MRYRYTYIYIHIYQQRTKVESLEIWLETASFAAPTFGVGFFPMARNGCCLPDLSQNRPGASVAGQEFMGFLTQPSRYLKFALFDAF